MRQGLNTHISSYRLYSAEGLVSIWYISPLTKLTVNWKLWHKSISPYSITGLFKMIVGVLTTCHTQYTSDRGICIFFIYFYGVMLRIRFIFLLFPQVSRNWRYVSESPLKVRIRIAIETITADMLRTVWNELDYRVDVCRITKGARIEHLYGT